jgi:hypothetical protein
MSRYLANSVCPGRKDYLWGSDFTIGATRYHSTRIPWLVKWVMFATSVALIGSMHSVIEVNGLELIDIKGFSG